jgi:copper transport protein
VSAVAPSLSGHALTAPLPPLAITSDALHVIAAGGWVGALFLLVLAGLPAARRAGARAPAQAALLVNTFSPVALVFAAVLVATGVITTLLHAGSLDALLASAWARILGLKLIAVATVVAFGAWNWRRGRHALTSDAGVARIRRSARTELASGVLVLLITAVLVATPPPAEELPPDGEEHVTHGR